MVARVDEHAGLRPCSAREHQRHAPIGDVGVVERRLERLVFDQQPLIRVEGGVRGLQPPLEPAPALPNVGRARIVRAVGEP